MALTPQERERTRFHLGYLDVGFSASISFGIPRPIQTLFLVEKAMDELLPVAEDRVRRYLQILDNIECRLVSAQTRLAADQLGDLKIRQNEPDLLEKEYCRWAGRLADIFGVPLYAYSTRFKNMITGVNVPVRS